MVVWSKSVNSEKSGDHKLLGFSTRFNDNPCDICRDISILSKVVDRPTDRLTLPFLYSHMVSVAENSIAYML